MEILLYKYVSKDTIFSLARPDCSGEEAKSLLDMLYDCYRERNPILTQEIQKDFAGLNDILSKLPLAGVDAVFRTVSDLCFEYELHAFSHGLVVGMHLMTELNALP